MSEQNKPPKKVQVGQIVHFVAAREPNECMAAIITSIERNDCTGCQVNLAVFTTERLDFLREPYWYSKEVKPMTWHFLENE